MNNVERIRRTGLILIGVGLLWALFARGLQPTLSAPARDEGASDTGTSELRVVEASQERLLLELRLGEYAFEAVTTPEGVCHQLVVLGYDNAGSPGHPSLPVVGAVAGVPLTGEPTVRVLDAASQVLPSTYVLCPQPQPALDDDPPQEDVPGIVDWVMTFDPDAYETDAFLPEAPAEIGEVAFIRDQRVATVRVHPFQYNLATGEIRVYTRLRVELAFNTTAPAGMSSASATPPATTDVWERSLRSLLVNYDTARNWRGTLRETPGAVQVQSLTPDQAAPRYRIETEGPGLYALTFDEIQAADPSVDLSGADPARLRITNQDVEIAIEVNDGGDDSFDSGDVIYFYAEALETKYTNRNVYWLSWDAENGSRIATSNAAPLGAATVPTYFVTTEIFEENHLYRAHRISADGDNWYWDRPIAVGKPVTAAYSFEVADLAAAPSTATLTTFLLGYQANGEHSIAMQLNSHSIYTNTWPAATEHIFTVTVPSTYLLAGTNTVSITVGAGITPTNQIDDRLYVNRFRLTYGKTYTANDDVLFFDGDNAGTWEYNLGGFGTDTVRILDITDPKRPFELVGAKPTQNGSAYTFALSQTIPGERHYYAVAPTQLRSPRSVVRDAVSDLRSTERGADYVIITHADFASAAQELATYRAGQGLRTVVVDVQDVYDEFNFGIPDPGAIHAFLSHAYHHWTPPAPTYVVLLGDGHYDPKGNLDVGAPPNFIPPYLADVDPWLRETAADSRYVAVAGDDAFPDMHIGRLPANTLKEAAAMVAKIMSYEQAPIGSWPRDVLFVADNPDSAGYFDRDMDRAADHYLPAPYRAEKIYLYLSEEDTPEEKQAKIEAARTGIQNAINQGRLMVNYAGHGATQRWATERLLTVDTAAELTNTGKLPFMVPMTCWEGYFIEPDPANAALAETLVRLPDRGAIASWSATGLGLATGHDTLNRALFDALFHRDMVELGPATTYAKLSLYTRSSSNHDLIDTFTLFGDPATRLKVLPVDPRLEKQTVGGRTGFKSGEAISYTLTYSNVGSATAHNVTISDTLPVALGAPSWMSSELITAQTGSGYVWDVGSLPAHAGGTITITAVISSDFDGFLTNIAEITTTSVMSTPFDNRSEVTVRVAQNTTDVQITGLSVTGGRDDTSPLRSGDHLTYTLTYVNAGPDMAYDVVLTDTVPARVTDAAFTTSGAPATPRSGTRFVWDIGDLMSGESGTVTITGILSRSLYQGPLTNSVAISTSSVDITLANNTASVTVMVSPEQVYLPLLIKGGIGR